MRIYTRPVIPKPLRPEAFYKAFEVAAEETTKDWDKQFAKGVQTWDQKPKFKRTVSVNLNRVGFSTTTDDRLYRFIHDGTRVGYAVMTDPWQSKTVPGRLGSRAGVGGRAYLNLARPVRPGVKARNWSPLVAKTTEKRTLQRFNKAMARGARGSGHAI